MIGVGFVKEKIVYPLSSYDLKYGIRASVICSYSIQRF